MIKTVDNCRLCGSTKIKTVFDFGLSPLANRFKSQDTLDQEELKFPLRYFKCSECHSVQLKDEVESGVLFKEYLYESPPNLIPHFKELAQTTYRCLNLEPESLVLDIGSNNGLLLQEFKALGCKVQGIEPAKKIAQKASDAGVPTINNFFTKEFGQQLAVGGFHPKLITCTNCFAHLSDLNGFVEGLRALLTDSSYFVFENAYLSKTIKNQDFGQAYFEHFFMHSIIPLEQLFKRHDLELFRIEYNNVQMGSIRGYVRRQTNQSIPLDGSVQLGVLGEKLQKLTEVEVYESFMNNIDKAKESLISKLKAAVSEGKTISIYGWPAKMTLINAYFGLEEYFTYVIEESAVKTGLFCPGTRLEIKNLDYFKANPTDICLIGAYNFSEDIKRKTQWYEGEWLLPI